MQPYFLKEGIELLAIGQETLEEAGRRIVSCEQCDPSSATSFSTCLDGLTGRRRSDTEYVLGEQARCRGCQSAVAETTLIHVSSPPISMQQGLPQERNSVEAGIADADDADIIVVAAATLTEARSWIAGCEHCSEGAFITFDYILDGITGCNRALTEYLLSCPATCPRCFHEVSGKTLLLPG